MFFESSKEFNERLKDLLEEKNIKPSELAKYIDVSRSTVSLWLSGKRNPTEDNKDEICKALNISYLELLHSKEEIALARIRLFFDRFNLKTSDYERFEDLTEELAMKFIDIVHKYRKVE